MYQNLTDKDFLGLCERFIGGYLSKLSDDIENLCDEDMREDAIETEIEVGKFYEEISRRLELANAIPEATLKPTLVIPIYNTACDEISEGVVVMSKEWYGIVRWNPADVIAAAANNGVKMTQKQAIEWWEENEEAFKNRMVENGNEMLSYMKF